MARILISGASGMVGSVLVPTLRAGRAQMCDSARAGVHLAPTEQTVRVGSYCGPFLPITCFRLRRRHSFSPGEIIVGAGLPREGLHSRQSVFRHHPFGPGLGAG